MLWSEDIPIIKENNYSVKIIAGNYNATQGVAPPPNSWAANTDNQVRILIVEIDKEVLLIGWQALKIATQFVIVLKAITFWLTNKKWYQIMA